MFRERRLRSETRLRAVRSIRGVVIAAGTVQLLIAGGTQAQAQAQAPDCPPGWVCPQSPDPAPSTGLSEDQMRLELMQRSMGFGGLFGPALQDWLNSPSAPAAGNGDCDGYTDYAAQQACGAGDLWAADRLQQDISTPEERDWYNR